MVLNNFTFFPILGLPLIAWGGITTLTLAIITLYTGLTTKPIKIHKTLAIITVISGLIHGSLGILSFF